MATFGTRNSAAPMLGPDDAANLRAAFNALKAEYDVLVAKLNADAGVTDTDYAVSAVADLTAG